MDSHVGEVLLDILVVLVAAKLAAEVAERINVPAVVAEILAGVVIGPSVLGLVDINETLAVLGELGVILLLLQVGMEMDPTEFGAVGRSALSVAVLGVVVPMVGGYGVVLALGESSNTALFLGASLAATSVGITARVFADLRALATTEARTVLGAAVADDVLGLVVLTIVVRIVTGGSVSVWSVTGIVALAIGFLVVATVLGSLLAPRFFHFLQGRARSAGTMVALALAFTLAFAELAEFAKLAPIVGAFVAGLALARSSAKERITRELAPVGHLFIPVFFLSIGISAEVSRFGDLSVLRLAAALLVVAVAGKLVTGFASGDGDGLLVGLGMIPRGEVGLIFAAIGLASGVLTDDLYASLLVVVLASTLMTPPLLRWRITRVRANHRRNAVASPEPPGGWLITRDGVLELAAEPPDELALQVGLEAARALADAEPGPGLLQWLSRVDDESLRWDDGATERLLAVLRHGSARSWRFLDLTGLLERSLPELGDAVARRRSDPSVLDPNQLLYWAISERMRDLGSWDPRFRAEEERLSRPEWLALAALILDVTGDDPPVELAHRLATRMELGVEAEEELALLVGETNLMQAAANRLDGLDEDRVLPMAIHLDRPERARALYLLTLAMGEVEAPVRERLDELLDRVLAVLEQPELTGLAVRELVDRRRAEAEAVAGSDRTLRDRIRHAPRGYLLTEDSQAVARQAALLEPLPRRDTARARVHPIGPGEWRVEVGLRDRRGLLAIVSGVLATLGLDVTDAVVATWPDGAALERFVVRPALEHSGATPDADVLSAAIVVALDGPVGAPPMPDAVVTFDDDASPWYTICEVRAPDRPGILHSITVGLAHAGTSVHSARLASSGTEVADRFELTDERAAKLEDGAKSAVIDAILRGVAPERLARRRRMPWSRSASPTRGA